MSQVRITSQTRTFIFIILVLTNLRVLYSSATIFMHYYLNSKIIIMFIRNSCYHNLEGIILIIRMTLVIDLMKTSDNQ